MKDWRNAENGCLIILSLSVRLPNRQMQRRKILEEKTTEESGVKCGPFPGRAATVVHWRDWVQYQEYLYLRAEQGGDVSRQELTGHLTGQSNMNLLTASPGKTTTTTCPPTMIQPPGLLHYLCHLHTHLMSPISPVSLHGAAAGRAYLSLGVCRHPIREIPR